MSGTALNTVGSPSMSGAHLGAGVCVTRLREASCAAAALGSDRQTSSTYYTYIFPMQDNF